MSKFNPKDICTLRDSVCTGPEQKWLAIHFLIAVKSRTFTFKDIKDGCIAMETELPKHRESDMYWAQYALSDIHVCPSTGYTDSKGDEVWGGQLIWLERLRPEQGTYLVYWCETANEWWARVCPPVSDVGDCPLSSLLNENPLFRIVGHIQPWPDEVSKMLSETEGS